jgi:hypothetical protein
LCDEGLECGLHDGGDGLAFSERFAAYGDVVRVRELVVQLRSPGEQRCRGEEMGEARRFRLVAFAASNFRATQLSGRKIASGIDEYDQVEVTCGFCEFRRELMASDYFDIRVVEVGGEFLGGMPAEAVVGAERVAVSDDQGARHAYTLLMGGALCLESRLASRSTGPLEPLLRRRGWSN